MVLLAVAFSRQLRTITNVFVVSLAVSDLLTSICLFWEAVARFGKDGWLFPDAQWLCGLTGVLVYVGVGASLTNMLAIAFDRVLHITRHSTYKLIFTPPKMVAMLILAWLFPICAVIAPLIVGFGTVGFDSSIYACQTSTLIPDGTPEVLLYSIVQGASTFVLLLTIALCYLIIYCFLRQNYKTQKMRRQRELPLSKIPTSQSNQEEVADPPPIRPRSNTITQRLTKDIARMDKQQLKITKNLFLVVCVYALSVFSVVFFSALPIPRRAVIYVQLGIPASSVVNPVIYLRKHPHFSVTLKAMLKCRYRDIPQPSNILRFFLRRD